MVDLGDKLRRKIREMTDEEAKLYGDYIREADEHLRRFAMVVNEDPPDPDKCFEVLVQLNEDFYRLGIPGFQQTTRDC